MATATTPERAESRDAVVNAYVEAFETTEVERRGEPERLRRLRTDAIARFAELGFPSTRQEEWRFTNVAPIAKTRFERVSGEAPFEPARLQPYRYEEMSALVFVDGRYREELSDLAGLPDGVEVRSLARALADGDIGGDVLERLAIHAEFDEQPFVALNTAFFADGAVVRVPRGVVVERPIQIVYAAAGRPQDGAPPVTFPRTLIVAEENSQATVVETYCGLGGGEEGEDGEDGVYFTCPVTELLADVSAVVDHYRLQQESTVAHQVALQQFWAARAANVSSHSISTGGALVRNDVRAVLAGEGIDATLNGLYLTKGTQHVDNHMWVEHREPHCDSHELYKGILEGRSRAVFNGLIHVHQDAQKTDAKQTNRNLLLSRDALVNTNPQLLIFADDVKCTHGSTVGQLDEEAVFYLRSRGIGEEAAKSLLIYAFARDIADRIRLDSVRADLEEFLFTRLPKGEIVRQAV